MLPKKFRVKKQDFPKIIREGLVFYSKHLILRVYTGSEKEKSLFSCVVSTKTAKTSVKRHFLRRRFYSIIEREQSKIKPGFSFIFHIKQPFLASDLKEISEEFFGLLKNAKALN